MPSITERRALKMLNLNEDALLTQALELTKRAMDNQMISISTDSKETAQNVVDFYHTILTTLNSED